MEESSNSPTPKKYEQLDQSIGSNRRTDSLKIRKSNEIMNMATLPNMTISNDNPNQSLLSMANPSSAPF
jgi:hypothetical protein